MVIKIKKINPDAVIPSIIKKGDAIDLYTTKKISLTDPYTYTLEGLGLAVELPKGMVAKVFPRSSTFQKFGVVVPNSFGYIDNSYNGDNDEWKLPLYNLRVTSIPKHTRLVQFTVELSPMATIWQKLKWLFSNKIIIKRVDKLNNNDRNGIGSTGV